MEKNTRLEHYLGKLDKGLGQIPVSEKAEIITEIKSHILDAQAKDPSKKLDDILVAIGEPEFVANRYLIERGLKPMRAPTHPIVKWLVIGFLGTFTVIAILIVALIWKFTPIVKIQDDKVSLLGGTVDISGDKSSAMYFDRTMNLGGEPKVEEKLFDVSKIKSVNIMNGSGDIKVLPAKANKAILTVARKGYKCDLVAKIDSSGELLVTTSDKHNCSFTSVKMEVSPKTNIKVKAGSGNINIDGINGDIVAQTGSGDIGIFSESKTKTKWELTTGSGDVVVNLPKNASIDCDFVTGSGSVKNDFTCKKSSSIKISAKTGSGDISLKARK